MLQPCPFATPPENAQILANTGGKAHACVVGLKQVPEKQRCSCAAGLALDRMSCGDPVSADGWGYLSEYEQLAAGVGRSWRVTQLKLWAVASFDEWQAILGGLNLAETLVTLKLSFSGGAFQVSSDPSTMNSLRKLRGLTLRKVRGNLSFLQTLTQLQTLDLSGTRVSGSLSFLQNLTQLQQLHLANTQVSGSVTSLPLLTGLAELLVDGTQVGVPTEEHLATFAQQHPDCQLGHYSWHY